jgi:hypothetical protein
MTLEDYDRILEEAFSFLISEFSYSSQPAQSGGGRFGSASAGPGRIQSSAPMNGPVDMAPAARRVLLDDISCSVLTPFRQTLPNLSEAWLPVGKAGAPENEVPRSA